MRLTGKKTPEIVQRYALKGAAEGESRSHASSCVDWYGNSRPVFIGDRVFALMGYELVEGQPGQRGISEVARVNFAPKVQITRAD